MMKKLTKAALLAAAATFLLTGVTACFTSVNDDDEPTPEPKVYELAKMGLPDDVHATKIESANPTIVEIETKEETARTATVSEGKVIESVTVTPKSAGSTYFIITTDAEVETWYLPVTVTKDLEVQIDPDDLTDEEPAGGSNASGLTGTWTALDYATSTEYADKLAVDDGTKLGAVTVSGTGVNWRGGQNSDKTAYNKWSHLELGKAEKGCLTFTIGAESTVVVEAASTGSDNTSDIVLTTKDDTEGAVTGSAKTVSGSSYTEVTYASVSAGTYYLGAFPAADSGNNRGVRIKSITVTAK